MASRKKKTSLSNEEQLYVLEIFINRLNLHPETYPIVNNEECHLIENYDSRKSISNEYLSREGKTCLLVRTPSNLIQSVKSTPLSIEVYWISHGDEDHNPRNQAGYNLLCAATAFLPGCFRDRIAAAKDKIDGLSKSHTFTKIYSLTDEHGNPCGSISMCLRLSCFGNSIINHLTLHEKSFVFQGFPLGWKFPCTKLSGRDVNDEKYKTKCDDTSLLCKILDPTCWKLHDRNDYTEAEPVLTRPESPPRVSMDQPGFEKLTSAEKLNDDKYRNLIYKTYPDEPTCSCLPTDQSTHPMMCRSGCTRFCCMALRNPDAVKHFPSLATLASNNSKSDVKENVTSYDSTRMRGGKDIEDNNYLNSEALWNEEYRTWHQNDINLKNRMMGGSDYGASVYALSEPTTVIYEKSKETRAPLYKSRPRTADGIKEANCICPGKASSPWKTDASKYTKKPYIGADRMIRAFKEAQEFVDSLGQVPGLVGLGLMDPSESPYFGRDREIQRDYGAVRETPSERKRGYPVSASPAESASLNQCPAPCNTQIGKPIVSTISTPHIAPCTVCVTTAVPGRTGVVREAIPTLPEATLSSIVVKPRKKEDKKEERSEKQKELEITSSTPLDVDVGPCGEPKCKSRRKKAADRTVPHDDIVEEPQIQSTSTIVAKVPGKFMEKGRYPKGKPGPSGDRDRGPMKISRRVMRYVYSIGDVYPGTNYGHKNCIDPRFKVPANMGWLWNTTATVGKLKPRIGWKPGAIGRYLNELLKEAKGASTMGAGTSRMEDHRARSIPSRNSLRRGKVYKSMSYVSHQVKESEEDAEPPPTLHIHRKDGTYYVTMYPIRQETADASHQLEEPMKPLQFKIARNKDDASVASSSTASDMEIEFSPPAAVNRSFRRKPDVIHVDTQVRQQEILDAYELTTADTPKTTKKEKKGKREKRGKK
ncbi:uncharacterized protein LOC118648163 [Monomorium pharaonis]|uniref:uncharacterized protein LOC118648163 n=1 Tax=Monomorium pharaonis TaxID=307658 RepID=UPI001747596C|nr:uncharacterized protein LOC118648163 [Monomorium pharaonis]